MGAETEISFVFDTDVSSYSTKSIKKIYETTWFQLVLHGMRNSFNRVIQSNVPIEFTFTDRYKELLLKKSRNNLQYPYAFIVINDIDLTRDQVNISTMARRGLGSNRMQGTSTPISYIFPFKMNITLNVLDSDVNSLFSLMQSIFLSDACRGFNFGIKAFGLFSKIKVQKTGGISFNDATISTDQENDFGTGHLTCTFESTGWMGFTTLQPTVRGINIKMYTANPSETLERNDGPLPTDQLFGEYKLSFSEGPDGQIVTDKLFVSPSGQEPTDSSG